MLATDNGSPARSATAIVIVDIQRNFQAPVWVQTSYSVAIPETQSFGVNFLQVSATDGDSQVNENICLIFNPDLGGAAWPSG